jgi:hypothetical protein
LHSKSSTTAPSGLSSASSRGRLRQPFLSPFVQADTMSSVKRRRALVSGKCIIRLQFAVSLFGETQSREVGRAGDVCLRLHFNRKP